MPAHIDSKRARNLDAAGMVVAGKKQPAPSAPAVPTPDRSPELAHAVSAVVSELAQLTAEQRAAVFEMAAAGRAQTDALTAALAKLADRKPSAPEQWEFTITKRNRAGQIEALTCQQVK